MTSILFRCDGSVEIGMGHVIRCLALAEELQEKNCNITFAMRKSELGINTVKESYQVLQSNEKDFNYKEWLTDCIETTNTNILIMDMRDGLTREELRYIKKETGIKVVTIDDPEEKRLSADLAFYPPVPQVQKMDWNGFKGKLYSGWEYVILRKEFYKEYPKIKNEIPNILVTMGGTDPLDMIKFVVKSLDLIEENFTVTIILGSGYQHKERLNELLKSIKYKYDIFQNPPNVAELMSKSDLGIISFGQTAYELAALKVPALYLCLTDDHYESSKVFMNEGIGTTLKLFSDVKQQDIVEAVIFHQTEKHILKEMSLHSSLLCISDKFKLAQLIYQELGYA